MNTVHCPRALRAGAPPAAALVVLVAALVVTDRPLRVDRSLTRTALQHRTETGIDIAQTVISATAPIVMIIATALVAVAVWCRTRSIFQVGAICLAPAAAALLALAASAVVSRPGPSASIVIGAARHSSSFPSVAVAIVASATVTAGLVGFAARRRARQAAVTAALLTSIVAGIAGIYLGQLWASDAVGGILAGATVGFALAETVRPQSGESKRVTAASRVA